MRWIAAILAFTAIAAEAQTAAQHPTFEAASIKERKLQDLIRGSSGMQFLPGGRFSAKGVPLRALIQTAYDAPFFNLGPELQNSRDLLDRTPYDVEAVAGRDTIPSGTSAKMRDEQLRLMLQTLLADRFKLIIRRETVQASVYAIVVGKNGPKLKKALIQESDCKDRPTIKFPIDGSSCHSIIVDPRVGIRGQAVDIADLAKGLQPPSIFRTVIDKTGLDGLYNIQTEGWSVDVQPVRPDGTETQKEEAAAFADPSRATIFTVLDQLGLKLEQQLAPMEVIEVVHIERPTEN